MRHSGVEGRWSLVWLFPRGREKGRARMGSATVRHNVRVGQIEGGTGLEAPCVPGRMRRVALYRVSLVKEAHSPLYGASPLLESRAVVRFMAAHFADSAQEEFVAVFLNAANVPIGYQVISVGTLTEALVHPREAFKAAVVMNAAGIIFAHNHPSGGPAPSEADRALTTRLVQAGELLGIHVLDHIVIGDEGRSFSFGDHGWL